MKKILEGKKVITREENPHAAFPQGEKHTHYVNGVYADDKYRLISLVDGCWMGTTTFSNASVVAVFDREGNVVNSQSFGNAEVAERLFWELREMPLPSDIVLTKTMSEEQNPHASLETAYNGGGYQQPHFVLTSEDGVIIEVSDTSCGDFGSRIKVRFSGKYPEETIVSYGTMEGENESVDLPEAYHPYALALHAAYGYHIPDCRIHYHVGLPW